MVAKGSENLDNSENQGEPVDVQDLPAAEALSVGDGAEAVIEIVSLTPSGSPATAEDEDEGVDLAELELVEVEEGEEAAEADESGEAAAEAFELVDESGEVAAEAFEPVDESGEVEVAVAAEDLFDARDAEALADEALADEALVDEVLAETEAAPVESQAEGAPSAQELQSEFDEEWDLLVQRVTDLELAARLAELEGKGKAALAPLAERVERNEGLARESVRRLSRQITNLATENEERFEGVWNQMATINTWAKTMLKQLFQRVQELEEVEREPPPAEQGEEVEAILELQETTLDLGAQLDTLRTRLGELEQQPAAPQETLEALRARLDELELRPAQISAAADEALAARLEALEQRPEAAGGDEALAALTARLEALEQRPEAAEGDEALAALTARLEALEQRPEGASAEGDEALAALTARLEALEQRPEGASAEGDEALTARLEALEQGLATVADSDELEARVERLENVEPPAFSGSSELEALEVQLQALREEALPARLEALENALTGLRESEGALQARSGELEAALRARIEALEENAHGQLAALESASHAQRDQLETLQLQQATFAQQATVDARLEVLAACLEDQTDVPARIDQLETQLREAALEGLQARCDELAEQLQRQRAAADQALDQLAELRAALAERPDVEEVVEGAVREALARDKTGETGEQQKLEELRTSLLDQVDTQLAARVQLGTAELTRRMALLEKRTAGGLAQGSPTGSGAFATTGQMMALGYDSKFITLVREVKAVKERLNRLVEAPEELLNNPDFALALASQMPVGSGSDSVEVPVLTELLNSAEFKAMFDARVQRVLDYIKSTVVPQAVLRAQDR